MPNTHYRGVFDAAGGGVLGSSNDGVFVPRPQNNQTQTIKRRNKKAPSPNKHLDSHRKATSQSDSMSALKPGEKRDFNAPPGRRHYIAEVLENQGFTVPQCARRLGISQKEAERQLDPKSNLTLEQLFDWSEVLEAPLPELLPFDASTSDPIRNRAVLLRIMKTARQIQRMSRDTPIEYVAATLISQLLELVPDFDTIEPWPSVGKSRAAQVDALTLHRVDSVTSRFIENNS
ncbi:MAG: hypothetical protein ACOX0A_03225 [Thermoguttaceae bacterium]|jgi:transcriptional regulator with XRE-family HTH domain